MLLTLLSKTDYRGLMILKVQSLCWPGMMFKYTFMLLKPRLNTYGCMCG